MISNSGRSLNLLGISQYRMNVADNIMKNVILVIKRELVLVDSD